MTDGTHGTNGDAWLRVSYEDRPGGGAAAGGVLAEGFGPGAVAVAVVGVAQKRDFAAGGEFLFEATEVGAEFVVGGDA